MLLNYRVQLSIYRISRFAVVKPADYSILHFLCLFYEEMAFINVLSTKNVGKQPLSHSYRNNQYYSRFPVFLFNFCFRFMMLFVWRYQFLHEVEYTEYLFYSGGTSSEDVKVFRVRNPVWLYLHSLINITRTCIGFEWIEKKKLLSFSLQLIF